MATTTQELEINKSFAAHDAAKIALESAFRALAAVCATGQRPLRNQRIVSAEEFARLERELVAARETEQLAGAAAARYYPQRRDEVGEAIARGEVIDD